MKYKNHQVIHKEKSKLYVVNKTKIFVTYISLFLPKLISNRWFNVWHLAQCMNSVLMNRPKSLLLFFNTRCSVADFWPIIKCACWDMKFTVAQVMLSLFGHVLSADWFALCEICLSLAVWAKVKRCRQFSAPGCFVQCTHMISQWPITPLLSSQ